MTPPALEVLVVDDDPAIRDSLRLVLEHAGHRVAEAESGDDAIAALEKRRPDVVLLDLQMPGMHGLDALARLREIAPDIGVIIVTGEATVANAVRAGQRGAYDFIEKPPDRERLLDLIAEAARLTRLRRSTPAGDAGANAILGRSTAVATMLAQVERIAPASGRVLILGENGSGKELVAHAIHVASKRAAGPFVKMNCAAIPAELVESEMFGHERGAFTGAQQARKGRFEMADGGTLFMDEIGDLSLEAQAKLLRAIETGEVERVGGTRGTHVDVRVIAATHRDLAAGVADRSFREDLYYRLNVLPIHVPPLRERRGDIALLAAHFLEGFCRAEDQAPKRLTDEAFALLEEYHWPGNVRELRNLMERAAILVRGDTVGAEDLAPWLESEPAAGDGPGLRGEIERKEAGAIRKSLEAANWNVTQAATGLGIDRTNLHRKMRKYGIARR